MPRGNPRIESRLIMTSQQIALSLRTKAAALDPKIAHYFRDRQTNTRKRAQEDEGMRREGRKWQCAQAVMRVAADRHESGAWSGICSSPIAYYRHVSDFVSTVGKVLSGERGAAEFPNSAEVYRERYDAKDLAMLELLRELPSSPLHESDADKAHRLERDLKLRKIPGFFPSRPSAVNRMMALAELTPDMRVLEPSAGAGAIADAARAAGAIVECVEVNGDLRELLKLKGHTLLPERDFLELDPASEPAAYDRVLMNPPFEKFLDIEHVGHAYKFLKPSGVLISMMGPAAFFRDVPKAEEFRVWLRGIGGTVDDLPSGSFEMTGCPGKLVVIHKPSLARCPVISMSAIDRVAEIIPQPAQRQRRSAALTTKSETTPKPDCLCGHPHAMHSHRKPAYGCRSCNCIAWRTWNPRPWTGVRTILMNVGLANGWKPVDAAELEKRYQAEMIAQRPTILARTIEREKYWLKQTEGNIATTLKEIAEAEAELRALGGILAPSEAETPVVECAPETPAEAWRKVNPLPEAAAQEPVSAATGKPEAPKPAVAIRGGARDARLPVASTVLTREFRGTQITVTVLDEGFEYDGRVFSSLSAIAKLAAGGNRNGFAFFGLGRAS
jgi:hypothetical protein